MNSVTVVILLAVVARAHVEDHNADARYVMNRWADELVDRAAQASSRRADLEESTLGKPSQLTTPSSRGQRPTLLPCPSFCLPPPAILVRHDRNNHGQLKCAVQANPLLDQDPNLIVGSVNELKTVDRPDAPKDNMVQVRVYNIDRYGMSPLAAQALNKNIEAIWHVGVAVFGKEYWFGAKVEAQNLSEVEYAFGFGPTHVYDIGRTNLDPEEFDKWVFNEKAPEYAIEHYDCFNHNCHNFADELVFKLTGKSPADGGFPQWCLDHGGKALSEVSEGAASRIKWISNRIAKVMMVSWGKYNKERFVDKDGNKIWA